MAVRRQAVSTKLPLILAAVLTLCLLHAVSSFYRLSLARTTAWTKFREHQTGFNRTVVQAVRQSRPFSESWYLPAYIVCVCGACVCVSVCVCVGGWVGVSLCELCVCLCVCQADRVMDARSAAVYRPCQQHRQQCD